MSEKTLKVIAGAPDRPLRIGDVEIPCYVLEDETRVLVSRGMVQAVGMSPLSGGNRFALFTASKAINQFISNELMLGIENPVLFKNPLGGGNAHGYPATLLVDLCNAVLQARDAGTLTKQQLHIAERCDLLIRSLATVGVIALVDEATGYQDIRARRALATILERFIAKELQPWTRTFPYEFYERIYKLKGWVGPDGHRRTPLIGHYTNDIVYERLAPGVLEELRRLNPPLPYGNRPHRHHQWFTPDLGHPKLKEHLAGVMALMRASANWDAFRRNLARAYPKLNEQLPLQIEED